MQFGQAQTHLYIDQCFEMVRSGKVVLDITHRVPLTNASEDGDALAAGISSPQISQLITREIFLFVRATHLYDGLPLMGRCAPLRLQLV
jgi:hypothetical protein